jgi:hypothetical protein
MCAPCWHAKQLADNCERLLKVIDSMMPGVAHIVCDIGELNSALIDARKAITNWKAS